MINSKNNIKFNFLNDDPASNDKEVFDFYHKHISPSIKKILENNSCCHTIGLFGKWGTGKSTIIDIVAKATHNPIFVFDVWKYQDDALRRTFIIELIKFLNKEKITEIKIEDYSKELYSASSVSYKIEPDDLPSSTCIKILRWIRKHWFQTLTTIALIGWGVLLLVPSIKDLEFIRQIRQILITIGGIGFISSIMTPVITETLKEAVKSIFSYQNDLSRETQAIITTDRLNSPEQFENKFQEIMEKASPNLKDKKLIIVFDNIDRVSGDITIKILSTIKTFLNIPVIPNVTCIVPCDPNAIINQIRKHYDFQKQADNTDPVEFLRKLFNLIIWSPEFIGDDMEVYTKKQLSKTGDISKFLDSDEVAFVINQAFSDNPRQIKQFINNLISTLIIALGTNIGDRIKSNVPYLAKSLVIKQNYPEIYDRLKEKWFEPEKIVQDSDSLKFRNFMLDTSLITTDDARPFLYFKEPVLYSGIAKSDEFIKTLLYKSSEGARKILLTNKNKTSEIADMIISLLREYRNQKELLVNIFNTHLQVFEDLNVWKKITKKYYFDNIAESLNHHLWSEYLQLNHQIIFNRIIDNNLLTKSNRDSIIARYVSIFSGDEINNSSFSSELFVIIIENLRKRKSVLDNNQRVKISQALSNDQFASNGNILKIFQELEDQNNFITQDIMQKYIGKIGLDADFSVFHVYKNFIISKEILADPILVKLVNLLQTQNENYIFENTRMLLDNFISEILYNFSSFFRISGNPQNINNFIDLLIQLFNRGGWDQKWAMIECLELSKEIADSTRRSQIIQNVIDFFINTNAGFIQKVINSTKLNIEELITNNYSSIKQRFLTDSDVLRVFYDKLTDAQKKDVLLELISQKNNMGLDFISTLSELPGRDEIIIALLNRLNLLNPSDRQGGYNYIISVMNKKDGIEIKKLIAQQIADLLKRDQVEDKLIGLNLYRTSVYLSDELTREISRELIEFICQLGRPIISSDEHIIEAVMHNYNKLQEKIKKDFVFSLMDNLKPDKDNTIISLICTALSKIDPSYSNHKKDYDDLFVRIRTWPDDEAKSKVESFINNNKTASRHFKTSFS